MKHRTRSGPEIKNLEESLLFACQARLESWVSCLAKPEPSMCHYRIFTFWNKFSQPEQIYHCDSLINTRRYLGLSISYIIFILYYWVHLLYQIRTDYRVGKEIKTSAFSFFTHPSVTVCKCYILLPVNSSPWKNRCLLFKVDHLQK